METHETTAATEDDRKARQNEYRRNWRKAKRQAAGKKAQPKAVARDEVKAAPAQGAKYPGTPSWNDEVKASNPTQPVPDPKPKPVPEPDPDDDPKPDKAGKKPAEDDMIEVRLLHNYVPFDGAIKAPYPGNNPSEVVFEKIPAGTTIKIPRTEARRAIKLGIAAIDHDLI